VSLRPPSGTPPPATFAIGADEIDLAPLAWATCARYYAAYPEDHERYGVEGEKWCRHDTQWLLCWAAGDVVGATDLAEQVTWLARVLQARDFAVGKLARNLELAAEVVAEAGAFGDACAAVAERLRQAAATVAALDLGGGGAPVD
jgi:hypothetical protein